MCGDTTPREGRYAATVVIVTGAGSGIGLATACRLAAEGATLVLSDVRPAAGAVAELVASSSAISFEETDVADADAVDRLFDAAVARHGRVDILVHSAGVALVADVVDTTVGDWERLIGVNLTGAFLCNRAAVRHMRTSGGGSIVNVASEEGLVGGTLSAAYCASKGGVVQLTRAVALDHARQGIRVNAVCPGPVETPLLQEFFDGKQNPAEAQRRVEASIPMGRLGHPDEIAAVIAFVASAEASLLTGSVIVADGGLTAG